MPARDHPQTKLSALDPDLIEGSRNSNSGADMLLNRDADHSETIMKSFKPRRI